jgi:DNA primase
VRFDDTVKREVLTRTDIAEYIGQFVTLRKRGNSLVGLCPFHAEKTPSFHVHPERGFFKCFGCDAHGDVISYLRRAENLTFPDALRVLAKRAGIEVEAENPVAARARNEKEAIYAANAVECWRLKPRANRGARIASGAAWIAQPSTRSKSAMRPIAGTA